MIGDGYWSTGIVLKPHGPYKGGFGWTLKADYLDAGWCEDDSTEGELRVRYVVTDVLRAAEILKADAEKWGIVFRDDVPGCPTVYVEGDGEQDPPYPDNWRDVAHEVADALGWECAYRREMADD